MQIDHETVQRWVQEKRDKDGYAAIAIDLYLYVAQRAAEQEREACAMICSSLEQAWRVPDTEVFTLKQAARIGVRKGCAVAAQEIESTIRARGCAAAKEGAQQV